VNAARLELDVETFSEVQDVCLDGRRVGDVRDSREPAYRRDEQDAAPPSGREARAEVMDEG
jgi:hypothetical protein